MRTDATTLNWYYAERLRGRSSLRLELGAREEARSVELFVSGFEGAPAAMEVARRRQYHYAALAVQVYYLACR